MSCTECGRKGGCDARKGTMFEAIEHALGRLYPGRSWNRRDEAAAFGAGLSAGEGDALARALAARLHTTAVFRAGDPDETCDYVYVQCLGRPPSLLEWREGTLDDTRASVVRAALAQAGAAGIDELYLRVALSSLARFAAVQEVAVSARSGEGDGAVLLTETPRAGVFDPMLLRRVQQLVGVLAEQQIRHLDFGEIVEPPADYDPGDYLAEWGRPPAIANYLFYPQPPATIVSTTLT